MKNIILLIFAVLLVIPATATAECKIKLEWAPQSNDQVAGYMLFCRAEGDSYDYNDPVWEGDGTFTQCLIDGLDEEQKYFFVMRSVDNQDNQSYDSNEIEFEYGADAGLGGDGLVVSHVSSCFIQTLSH